MAQPKSNFVCQQCGQLHGQWAGQCSQCGAWNSLRAEAQSVVRPLGGKARAKPQGKAHAFHALADTDSGDAPPRRWRSGIDEFDRVSGGGLVAGAVVLLGGDPGIGKSTLLMQLAAACASPQDKDGEANVNKDDDANVLYVSGEESLQQLRLRAERLALASPRGGAPRAAAPNLQLACMTELDDILASLAQNKPPRLIVIDSIQTMWTARLDAVPGTVTQLRATTQLLIDYAKQNNTAVVLVGHVTKDGQIAGPRVLEHMVDVVIYFEGEQASGLRLLRAVKNRFGPANEIGVFEMQAQGLVEVRNPSELFLHTGEARLPGSAVFAGLEGTRPLLVEVQALTAPSTLAAPRRAVLGWDAARLSMILAVLEARAGLKFTGRDVFLNIAGGLRVQDPAADLAVAAALASSLTGRLWPADMVAFGEVSLSGALRPVGQSAARLKEAARLGFKRALSPPEPNARDRAASDKLLPRQTITALADLVAVLEEPHAV